MKELSKILRVLLKRMPYEPLYRNRLDCMNLDRELLNKAVHTYMPEFSETEIQNMLESLKDTLDSYAGFLNLRHAQTEGISVFDAVFRFSDSVLVRRNNEIMCRYEFLLKWRMTTKDISEEIFVTAYQARRDQEAGVYCKDFTWPTVTGHNNMQLRDITGRGLAENHFHLWGSAPYFQLAWIWMMNHPAMVEVGREPESIDQNLRTTYMVYDKQYPEKDMRSCCLQASLIRALLYSIITDTPFILGEYYTEWEVLRPWLAGFDCKIRRDTVEDIWRNNGNGTAGDFVETLFAAVRDTGEPAWREFGQYLPALKRILNRKPEFYARTRKDADGEYYSFRDILESFLSRQKKLKLPDCRLFLPGEVFARLWKEASVKKAVFYLNNYEALIRHLDQVQNAIDTLGCDCDQEDYALKTVNSGKYHQNESNAVLCGERKFLYDMFRRTDARDKSFSVQIYNLFYAYLILKEKVRSEMVQSNDWCGFQNFAVYQNRKNFFSSGESLDRMKARMAVQSCLEQKVRLLEIRICFERTLREMYETVMYLDHSIEPDADKRSCFFYVLHFIKKPEEAPEEIYCDCRNGILRRECEKRAQMFLEFRRVYPGAARRILGIDAANQEIGCRPEVFAQAFRALQEDTCIVYSSGGYVKLPQLRATYHVGEDFLDVADGLRAVDEAVLFLGLDCGDRIGHGLVLGISVREWYKTKNMHISLAKQDYLDNIVWLYFAIIRYRIEGFDNLKHEIIKNFEKYFSEIYGKFMGTDYLEDIRKASGRNEYGGTLTFDIYAYYDAWKLRGDAPGLYKKGYFPKYRSCSSNYEKAAVNAKYPQDFTIRLRPEVSILYHYYHYNRNVRLEGRKKTDVTVSEDYIRAVGLVQKALRREVAARGIAVETNPSSNVMIGTFRHYEDHPITELYNTGLTYDEKRLKDSPQLCVSINTDDQGVFGIKLENEYALLALALEKKKDENGDLVYQKAMIYEWLDKIRRMGFSQSFGNINFKDSRK